MNEPISEADKQLRGTPHVSLIIATKLNRTRRNAYLFFGLFAAVLIFFFTWSKWLFLFPGLLGIGALLHQMNHVIVASEIKRRSKELPEKPE